jgi:hypothetical protein
MLLFYSGIESDTSLHGKRFKIEDGTLSSSHNSMRYLSLCGGHVMVLLPIVNTFPQAVALL